ncbi:MAG: hypothetical protein MPK05_03035 [Gammaproteobacteria bacterium]|nr:hypothetical protein [Gammaproteobacteria bacterium]
MRADADKNKNLGRFYTKPEVARACWQVFARTAGQLGMDLRAYWFVEPAAGCGCFWQLLPQGRRTGIDLAPGKLPRIDNAGIERADYFDWRPPMRRKYAVIGNPPFGRRGKLAVAFFNHSDFADTIALVLPVTFRKYATHRLLPAQYQLVRREPLARDSFCTPDGKDFAVNAEFQIWTRLPHRMKNLRAHAPPPRAHPDFQMRQYNNTRQALKEFDAPFDFAVPCQGYQDYSRRETEAANCEKHKQWMLFTAPTAAARNRLLQMDFAALALDSATAVPGFRKNDVVREYAAERESAAN